MSKKIIHVNIPKLPQFSFDFNEAIKEHVEVIHNKKESIMQMWLRSTFHSYLGEVPSGAQIKANGEIIEYQRAIGQFSRYELKWENKVIGSLDMAKVMGSL